MLLWTLNGSIRLGISSLEVAVVRNSVFGKWIDPGEGAGV